MPETPQRKTKKEERNHAINIMLNDSEMRMLQRYCDRYDVRNRSKLIREVLMTHVVKQLDKTNPTLFD